MRRREFLKIAAACGGAAAVPAAWLMGTGTSAAEETANASAIVFNQLGYMPSAAKFITLRAPSAGSTVRNVASGAVVLKDKTGAARDDAASGDRVQICDISAVSNPGTYVLETDVGKSAPFEIGNDVYRHALWLTMRSYYGQRCGCNVDLGGGYAHPACHLAAEFHRTSGKSG